jgi:Flp pilus assembly protein TadD
MDTFDSSIRMKTLALTTAMASALLSGCAANPAPRADITATQAQEALAEGRTNRALTLAEQTVQADPTNASYRAMLGKAYLDSGRFASAETAFNDAMTLGDTSPRTALSLALAQVGQAKYAEAGALLNQWEGQIATADMGLALALSGQPERGIHLMGNAIRSGDDTVKMRQNLAYAYAVAGRWREARVMAAQDVPASELGNRMEQWAAMASPEAFNTRVASLLGVPAGVQDMGQPTALALGNTPSVPQLAAEAAGQIAAPEAVANAELAAIQAPATGRYASAEGTLAVPAAGSELPAVGAAQPVNAFTETQSDFARAFSSPAAEPAPATASLAAVAQDAAQFASQPVVQQVPQTASTRRAAAPQQIAAVSPVSGADATHLVQLGSFTSEDRARRAWSIYTSRYPELANHEMVITEAVVRGKRYFRVSAGGFNLANSRSMCGRVSASGGDGCISWAAASPLPGAVPARVDNGVRLARRD